MMNRFQTSPVQVRDELARLMGAALHEGIRRLFAQIERQLFDLAASETDSDRRAEAFDAISRCRGEQEGFYRRLVQALLEPSADWQEAALHQLAGDRSQGLKLEDELAEASLRCGIEHAQFEARVGQLHHDDPTYVPAGLFTLGSISRAFLAQVHDLPDDMRQRLIAHWAEQVLYRLTPIYSVLNDYLIQVGVLPGIKRLREPQTEVAPARGQAPVSPAAPDVPEHPGPGPQALADRLAPLVSATIEGDDQYLFRFVRDHDWRTEDFAAFIMHRLEPTLPANNWPVASREVIRLVGMTFGDVLNDGLIDPRHRRQIATLQLAVLMLAARDRHFLSDADHPMRRILNLLALIGSDPDLKPNIESTAALLGPIQRAALDDTAELDALAGHLRDISRGKAPESPESPGSPGSPRSLEPAIKPAHERLAQIEERCRVRVGKILAGHVDDTPLRAPTRTLLDQVFQPFMVRTMINQGRQSAPWAGIIGLLQDALTLQLDPFLGPEDVDAFSRDASQVFNDTSGDGLLTDEQQCFDAFVDYLVEQSRNHPEIPENTEKPRGPAPESVQPALEENDEATDVEPAVSGVTEATPTPDTDESASSGPLAATASAESPTADEPSRDATETSGATESPETSHVPETAHVPGTAHIDSAIGATGDEEEPSSRAIPADGLLLASLDAVQNFFRQQRSSEEWFEVYTGPGRALRRLKIGDLDSENGVVNFANRTGQAKLSLPVGQVLDDLFAERTRLVFGNPRFARALALLRERLEEHRDEH